MEGSGICSACFLRKRGAAVSGLALSVTAYAVPPLPKGEALAKPEALHLNREVYRHAKGSPFGGAGALAPERARTFAGGRSLPRGELSRSD